MNTTNPKPAPQTDALAAKAAVRIVHELAKLPGLHTVTTEQAEAIIAAEYAPLVTALEAMIALTEHAFDAEDPDMDLPELYHARAALAAVQGEQS